MFFSARSAASIHSAVAFLVGLRARRPYSRAPAPVEHLELNAGRIDRARHQPAERVNLGDEMSLCRAADRRIARHVRNRVLRQRADRDAPPKTCGGVCRFTSCVSRAYHDHVVLSAMCLYLNAKTQGASFFQRSLRVSRLALRLQSLSYTKPRENVPQQIV